MTDLAGRLARLEPLSDSSLAALRRLFVAEDIRFTWASNALEGNTLTLRETQRVVEDGVTIPGKSMREHLEAVNHAVAVQRMHALVDAREPLTVQVMLELHGLLMRGIDDAWAGRIRNGAVAISGTAYRPPHAAAASAGVDEAFARYTERAERDHPVLVAADLHYEIARLHPFFDGNGRTVRLLMNAHLLQRRYPPLIIEPQSRGAYLDALDTGQEIGDASAFRAFIVNEVERAIDHYMAILGV